MATLSSHSAFQAGKTGRGAVARPGAPAARGLGEQALCDLLENTAIGVLWVDGEGRVLQANPALLDWIGRPSEECLGRRLGEFQADPAETEDLMRRLRAGRVVRNFHLRARRPDGSVRHALADGQALRERRKFVRAALFVRDISERVELQSQLLHVSEREQQRIGRELHDSLGQHLHALFYLAALLEKGLAEKSPARAAEAARLSELLREAIELTHELAHGLQPVKPAPDGLMVALRELAARSRALYRVDCRFECRRPVLIAKSSVATHLYRIAQEAAHNAVKHAHPTRIRVTLAAEGPKVVLGVLDNGTGFRRPARQARGMGLNIMRYRAEAMDGSFVIQPGSRGGTEVVCAVPIPREAAAMGNPA